MLVTGCLAQRYKEEIIEEIPEVDAVLGTTSLEILLKAMIRYLKETVIWNLKILTALPKSVKNVF